MHFLPQEPLFGQVPFEGIFPRGTNALKAQDRAIAGGAEDNALLLGRHDARLIGLHRPASSARIGPWPKPLK